MSVAKSAAIVIGSFPLGESDRVVTFFTRRFGRVRGVARSARRMRSRFGSALELFTLGELVFFDNGRSDLVQVDHFDIVRPFDRLRDDLERLGHAAWLVECVARSTGERDTHAGIYALLARALASMEAGHRPGLVAVVFGVRYVDAVGHRLQIDACVGCARSIRGGAGPIPIDVEGGGALCHGCAGRVGGTVTVSAGTLESLRRLRVLAWDEAVTTRLGGVEGELRQVLEAQLTCIIGQPSRASRFLREVSRASPAPRGPR